MKVYKLTVMVIDYDNLEPSGVTEVVENTVYPNRCIFPRVVEVEARDIVDWSDKHALNQLSICDDAFKRLFELGVA